MPIAGKSWYKVKLVFSGLYIFLIFALKQGLWVLVNHLIVVELLMSSRGHFLLIRVSIYQNVCIHE